MDNGNDSTKAKFELWRQEIEGTSDEYWGPTFRAIYDGEDGNAFMDQLDSRIKLHDKDIEKMCNAHYQGFIDSIRELLQVRPQSNKLNSEVVEMNTALQASAAQNIEKMEELVKERRVESNIASAIESLTLCLPVLTTYAKLQKQMKEKRYYPALKTLEQLEHLHLPRVPNYNFSQKMRESIPTLRESIKEASVNDLKDFLERIRKFSPKIGEVAMKHTTEQIVCDTGISRKKKKRAPPPPNPFTGEVLTSNEEGGEVEEDLSAQELIDYSPIYRCQHIYSVMGLREDFERYYRMQRTEQACLELQPPTNMHESIDGYRSYLQAIVGFFVVEDHVFNTGNGLITRTYLDDLWNMALNKIVKALRTHTAYCTDASLMLQIKNLIMLTISTLRNYGYSVNQIFEILQEMHDHYNEVLMQRWVVVFREILEEENFLPIEVNDQEGYESIVNSFPYEDPVLESSLEFPKRFPFSPLVPSVYLQVKEFIYACLKFSEDLNLSQVEVDEMMRKSTNLLLTRTFTGCLSSLFRKPSLSLTQIIQVIIDTRYLEDATVYLQQFVSNITGSSLDNGLGGGCCCELFAAAKGDAEKQICEKLKAKLSEFIELESYDWLLIEPHGHASSYITDLIAFLRSTFTSFTNLPVEVAQVACKSACEHLAQSILGLMLNEDVKQLSMGALHQINLDTLQCEQFAASEPVGGLEETTLLSFFTELRQLLDLFMSWDWPTYFHDHGQENSKYQLVNPNTAIILLEKLREADKKTVFSVLKKSERDKKKLLETVLKQLKQLSVAAQQ